MKKTSKLFILFFSLFAVALASCSGGGSQASGTPTPQSSSQSTKKEETYTVNFDLNGGTIEGKTTYGPLTATQDKMPNVPNPDRREDYEFDGWYTDSAFNTKFAGRITSNITLYAKWTANYKVKFMIGTNQYEGAVVKSGNKVTRPTTDPTGNNQTFTGWYSDSALTTLFDFDSPITANTNIYAGFKDNETEGLVFELLPDDTYSIVGYDNQSFRVVNGKLVLPETHEGKAVTEIRNFKYEYLYEYSVEIPKNVKRIFPNAFDINKLTSITVNSENSVYYSPEGSNAVIEKNTKRLIVGCKTTVIPTDVEEIAPYAFYNINVKEFVIPNNIKKIDYRAFEKAKFKSVELSNQLEKISAYAFFDCTNLEELVIPDSVTEVGEYAFSFDYYSSSKLESVTVGSGIKELSSAMFMYGRSIKNVTLKEGLEIIGENAFNQCLNLETIVIPNGVKWIYDYAFRDCNNLTNFSVPSTLEYTGNIFNRSVSEYFNTKLNFYFDAHNSAYLGNEDNHYVLLMAYGNSIDDECRVIGNAVGYNTTDTILSIPDNVVSISKDSFMNGYINTLKIGKSLKFIDGDAFYGADFEKIEVHYQNESYFTNSLNNILVEKDSKKLIKATINPTITSDVEEIGEYSFAFNDRNTFRSINIPASVKRIDDKAFYSCNNLVNVTLNEGLEYIGDYAFSGTHIENITIPNSVTYIGVNAFSSGGEPTPNLNYTIDNGVKYLGSSVNPYLVLVTASDATITSYTVKDGCKIISRYAFKNMTELTSITLPDGLETLEFGAFSGCSSLTNINIPSSIAYIEKEAFYNTALTSIKVPESAVVNPEFIPDELYAKIDGGCFISSSTNDYYSFVCVDSETASNGYTFSIHSGTKNIIDLAIISTRMNAIIIPKSVNNVSNIHCYVDKVIYLGTMEEWNAVTTGFSDTVAVVFCTDNC